MASIFGILLAASTPSDEVMAAHADAQRLTPTEAANARYLSMYNFEIVDAREAADVGSFAVNSLSRRRRIKRPTKVTDTLQRIDLRDYSIDPKAWESLVVANRGGKLVRVDPYFAPQVVAPQESYALNAITGSYGAVLRLDYFVAKAFLEPHYSEFLGLPGNLKDLQKQIYVDEKGVKALGLQEGGAVLQSIVALHNRQLERWPTLTGAFWQSRDAGSSAGKQNVLEADNLFTIQHDAGEFIWNLPNGLQAYYLANADGKQQVEVPANLAIDSKTSLQDKRVRNAINCITCHAVGINPFENVIARMIRKGATYASYDKAVQLAVEEYHLSDLARQIERDNERFAEAVEAANGLEPKDNALAFERMVKRYLEDRIDLEIAAKEIGHDVETLRKRLPYTYSGTANALLAGESISRDAWQSIAYRAAKACCELEVKP